ncbi:hypothetical protein ACFPRL_19380 [Pseudoclavibacter helvolus]
MPAGPEHDVEARRRCRTSTRYCSAAYSSSSSGCAMVGIGAVSGRPSRCSFRFCNCHRTVRMRNHTGAARNGSRVSSP